MGNFVNVRCERCEQVKTLELGSADLDKYHQALDKALVTYHAEKMQEVNEIAKFLWGQVRCTVPPFNLFRQYIIGAQPFVHRLIKGRISKASRFVQMKVLAKNRTTTDC
jgi:hypothetical protein